MEQMKYHLSFFNKAIYKTDTESRILLGEMWMPLIK